MGFYKEPEVTGMVVHEMGLFMLKNMFKYLFLPSEIPRFIARFSHL